MRTFAQIPKATQQTSSAQRVKASPMASKRHRDVQCILQLQRSLGNQAMQRLRRTHSESLEVEPGIQATPCFGHDFSKAQTFETAMEKYYAARTVLCGPAVDCTGKKATFCP